MDGLIGDVRVAARNLRRSPGYSCVAAATLVLGIGVNLTIFSLVNGAFLKPIPGIMAPDRLVNISRAVGNDYWDMSYPVVQGLRERSAELEEVAALALTPVSVADASAPAVLMGMSVTGSYFSVLGLVPSAGAFFTDAQTFPTAASVIVISHDLWQRQFDGRPDVLGRVVQVNGYATRIIGITPPGFSGHASPLRVDVFLPLGLPAPGLVAPTGLRDPQSSIVEVIGRLAGGSTAATAAPALSSLAGQINRELLPGSSADTYRVRVDEFSPVPGPIRGGVTVFVTVLMGIVGLVLLMACTNVAGMFLFRSVQRRTEIAIRQALGAARVRVIRLLVTESVLLFLVAGAIAVVLAQWATGLLLAFEPPTPPGFVIDLDLGLDGRVVTYALGLTVVCGVLFGLTPAVRATGRPIVTALRRDAMSAPDRTRFRSFLVFGQTAVTVLLLVVAGLFLRSITSLAGLDTGWSADRVHVVTMDVQLDGTDEPRGRVFYRELLERVSGMSGIESAALAAKLPLAGSSRLGAINVDGVPPPPGRAGHEASFNRVSPGYFETLRIPILAGRDVAAADRAEEPNVAVVNRAMATRFWGDPLEAVGRRFFVGQAGQGTAFEVVGVVADAKYSRLTEDPQNFFYVPFEQRYNSQMSLHVRATRGAEPLVRAGIAGMIRELDPSLPAEPMRPLEESLEVFFLPQRMAAWVSGLMGTLGLILGAVGVYGVTSFSVAQRRREMGVRLALGARPVDVVSMIVRQGMLSPAAGVVTGLGLAFGVTRFLSTLLAGISPLDPVTFLGVVVVLGLVAAVAVSVPAFGAARTDPVVTLRAE